MPTVREEEGKEVKRGNWVKRRPSVVQMCRKKTVASK
jgi:hypothetical protein